MNTEAVVYLLRKTSLTREAIGKLTPEQFTEIIKEVSYQEEVEAYRASYQTASLLAAIYNTIPRKRGSKVFKASDFMSGDAPTRATVQPESLDQMAESKGIMLPSKELRSRK